MTGRHHLLAVIRRDLLQLRTYLAHPLVQGVYEQKEYFTTLLQQTEAQLAEHEQDYATEPPPSRYATEPPPSRSQAHPGCKGVHCMHGYCR